MNEIPIQDLIKDVLTFEGSKTIAEMLLLCKKNFEHLEKEGDGSWGQPSAKQFAEIVDKMISNKIVERRGYILSIVEEE